MGLNFKTNKTSFHIITGGKKTKKDNFIGFDFYGNYVFISKETYIRNNFSSIGDVFPIYCLATEKKIKSKYLAQKEYLDCFFMSIDFIEIKQKLNYFAYEYEINKPAKPQYIKLSESATIDFHQYDEIKKNKERDKYLIALNNDVSLNLPTLFIPKRSIQIKNILFKYNYFYSYEIEHFNMEDLSIERTYIIEKIKELKLQIFNENTFQIKIIPLYRSLRKLLEEGHYESEMPYRKIITKKEIEDFNLYSWDYYETINPDDIKIDDDLIIDYFAEHKKKFIFPTVKTNKDFKSRLRERFNSMYVFEITPCFNYRPNEDGVYAVDKHEVDILKQNLVAIFKELENNNINNVILGIPDDVESEILNYIHYYDEQLCESDESYDWSELGEQEMRSWDDETNGSWRIENDFG